MVYALSHAPCIPHDQMEAVLDWDKGLPTDMLGLVAQAGGVEELKRSMRGVSKTWQDGFELGVRGITLGTQAPPYLPFRILGPSRRRFPLVSSLDLGLSSIHEAWLSGLGARFPNLACLILGNQPSPVAFPVLAPPVYSSTRPHPYSLVSRFSDACLAQFGEMRNLTSLNLI